MVLEDIIKSTKIFFKENKRLCITTGILVAASIVDAYTTSDFVSQFGLDCETNPVGRYFMELLGPTYGSYGYKAIIVPLVVGLARKTRNTNFWINFSSTWTIFGAASWYIYYS